MLSATGKVQTLPTELVPRHSDHLKSYTYREFFDFVTDIDHTFLLCVEMNRNIEAP